MAQGLQIPIKAIQGRPVVATGADEVRKIILLAMGDGLSANPFNTDVGVQAPVFALQDGASRAIIDQAVRRHFARLLAGGRAELTDLRIQTDDTKGETNVGVTYRDLETDEQRDLEISIGG